MLNPVLFSFKLFNFQVTLTWYGLIVMSGVLIAAWIAEREVRRRGENGEVLMDAMVWAVVAGIVGARLWYVMNALIGGNRSFIEDPLSIIRPPIAGLHIFGGFLLGAIVLVIYLRKNGYDAWLFMDAIAPVALLGQALGRWGNFINQELYGPPTNLPWGISIPADRRLLQFADLAKYPEATTRFHPTFAYEMILNVLAFLFIMWYSRRGEEDPKPGTLVSLWLIFAGFIRTFIEFFRPDQPHLGNTFITTSMLVAFLMGVAGVILFLARQGKIKIAALKDWEEEYVIKPATVKSSPRARRAELKAESEARLEEEETPAPKRKALTRAKRADDNMESKSLKKKLSAKEKESDA